MQAHDFSLLIFVMHGHRLAELRREGGQGERVGVGTREIVD